MGTPGAQYGRTALTCASYNGHLEVVKALLAAGADKEAKNTVGVVVTISGLVVVVVV